MKTDSIRKMILGVKVVGCFLIGCAAYGLCISINNLMKKDVKVTKSEDVELVYKTDIVENVQEEKEPEQETETVEEASVTVVEESPKATERHIVYDSMTIEELSAKLDRSLNSTLSGKGYLFAKNALELGVDPYLAVAIVLEETGCKWNCSSLVKQCNNVGGQKGGTVKCNGGAYRYYATLDEGIYGFIDNLARNYYAQGLTTPEQMNHKYAASTAWAAKVNNYIAEIRAS